MSPEDAKMLQQIQDRLDTLRLADEYSGIKYSTQEIERLAWVVETVKGYDNTVKILEDFVAQACKILEDRLKYDFLHGFEHYDDAAEFIETCEGLGLYEQEGL